MQNARRLRRRAIDLSGVFSCRALPVRLLLKVFILNCHTVIEKKLRPVSKRLL